MIYPAETTLSAALTSGATNVFVTSAAGFTAPCYLVVDSEIIYCPSAAVANEFSGVTRGALGTVAASHLDLEPLYGLYSTSYQPSAMGGLGGWWDEIAAELGTLEARIQTALEIHPSTQSANLAGTTRVAGTVYRNTGTLPIYVAATSQGVGPVIQALSDSNPSPAASVCFQDGTNYATVNFIVLPGNYYEVVVGAGTLTEWFELS